MYELLFNKSSQNLPVWINLPSAKNILETSFIPSNGQKREQEPLLLLHNSLDLGNCQFYDIFKDLEVL